MTSSRFIFSPESKKAIKTQISYSICISYFRQMNVKFVRQRPFNHRSTMRKGLFSQVVNLIRLFIA